MNELKLLTNTEKAKLLHQLFPCEISGLLDFIVDQCQSYEKNFDKINKYCADTAIIPVREWLKLSTDMAKLIQQVRANMIRSYHVFGDYMGDLGYCTLFNTHVVKYAEEVCETEKFCLMIYVLYW
jgi:hypothetical protein